LKLTVNFNVKRPAPPISPDPGSGGPLVLKDLFVGNGLRPLDTHDDVDMFQRNRMPRPILMEMIDLLEDDFAHPSQGSHPGGSPHVRSKFCG
jgi:hypothetical protein